VLGELLLGVVNVLVGFVLEVDDFLLGFIICLGGFSLLDHALNIVVTETTR
jgi:hypothetical protein